MAAWASSWWCVLQVVLHQGWLLKKGGMQKKWIKRYFVLYRTCMGHILCYYSDYTETALYSETAKVTCLDNTHIHITCIHIGHMTYDVKHTYRDKKVF